MTHLLVVEDEPDLLSMLILNLTSRGFQVSSATDGATALQRAAEQHPDLLLLDLGLPDIDGLEVIRQLQVNEPTLPIVVLSARSSSNDIVLALDLGATDYVTKPFEMAQLLARVGAITRRPSSDRRKEVVRLGDITVDRDTRTITHATNGTHTLVHLTPTEWRILDILLDRPNALVSSTELLTSLRGDAIHTDASYLRIYLAQLRRKLEPVPSQPRYLLTDPGLGYRFHP
ncbi:MAG: DNA-binding response regulator [Frankiales bacterium]|nr:DNA-binding response regulator [Frankiales bacterium]